MRHYLEAAEEVRIGTGAIWVLGLLRDPGKVVGISAEGQSG